MDNLRLSKKEFIIPPNEIIDGDIYFMPFLSISRGKNDKIIAWKSQHDLYKANDTFELSNDKQGVRLSDVGVFRFWSFDKER